MLVEQKMDDFLKPFAGKFGGEIHWNWPHELTLLLIGASVAVLFVVAGSFDGLFARYRRHALALRREKKKREHIARLVIGSSGGSGSETELLKRLTQYFVHSESSAGVSATPEQLLIFSQNLFRNIRRLEYDKRGRLVVPAIEQKLLNAAKPSVEKIAPGPAAPPSNSPVWRGFRATRETMSKASRVALSLIRLNKI